MDSPKTLQQAILFFSNPDTCIAYMAAKRWPDGVVACPTCGRVDVSWLANQKKWQCKTKHPKRQFSVKVGTLFEDSPIGLDKWLMASWLIANCKNGVSSYEIARDIGVTQKSAWFMMHRIRTAMGEDYAMQDGGTFTTGGHHHNPVEVDETFIGGKPKNKHIGKRNLESDKKAIVMGMLNRETRRVRAKVIPNVKRETLQREILENVGFNAHVYTDGAVGYEGLDKLKNFTHKTVNHVNEYVNGRVHTQGIENFWSLLKRGLNGTYVAVEPFHLDRYVDEQVFRFNNRLNMTDGQRFDKLMGEIAGKRLTYRELTGKLDELARREETGTGPR
jgi:transposase-like protein